MATAVAPSTVNGSDRRRSGRPSHAPPQFSQEQYHGSVLESAKRKRVSNVDSSGHDDSDNADEDQDSESEEDGAEAEDEPDEEEIREQTRKKWSRQPAAKPAAKRLRTTNGPSAALAIRSANAPAKKSVSKAAKQKARSRPSQIQATGLYADVFGKGNNAETAATSWHNQMESDHVQGITDIVNFVLQVIGCESRVEPDDIKDVDNVTNKLGDVLEQYAEQKEGDYPLSGRQKQYHGMKEVYTEFFREIPHALHNSGLLYEEKAIYENIHVWLATMSGAQYRSFRVTAALASLAMTTGQTEVAKEVQSSISATKHQLDTETKKRSSNKARLAKLQQEMEKEEQKMERIDEQLKDAFDTVYVHRYRDVEEKLRVAAASALGTWILNYRLMFLDGPYLRYLGWVMSDPHALTRLQVIRSLKAIYKVRNNLASLRGFTDRFRARMVEMGSRDANVAVRVETIELLNMLRGAEMLEPDDVDTIGQLIFDNEEQVRRAVSRFFVSNIQDLYNASIEDFDKEDFEAILPNVEELDDFDEPCKLWIKFKCLAQTLGAQTRDLASSSVRRLDLTGIDHLDSRYMVATQAIFAFMPELQEWESLAGYLLHDHSSITTRRSTDIADLIKEAYKLEQGEEIILLDVLYCAAKAYIVQSPENKSSGKAGKSKKEKDEVRAQQETAAHNLSAFIPQLHNKFGSVPRAAKSILRLNQLFNPDLMNDAEEEEGEIDAMLEDIKKEFTSHSDREVLAEATRALRTALGRESSRESASRKVDELWQNLLKLSMSPLLVEHDIGVRGLLERDNIRQLADVTGRLAQLATVKDCCEILEGKFTWLAHKNARKRKESVMEVMLQLVKRGKPDEDIPREEAELEDQVCTSAIRILLFYYRWKTVAIKTAISDNDASQLSIEALTTLAGHKNDFIGVLSPVIASRKPLDKVRIAALLNILDLHVLLATYRNMKPKKGSLGDEEQTNIGSLVTQLGSETMSAVMETHEKMEKRLARKLNKKNIELPLERAHNTKRQSRGDSAIATSASGHDEDEEAVDRPPEDSDEEDAPHKQNSESDDESSDDGDDTQATTEEGVSAKEVKRKSALMAETSLCELTAKIVWALVAGIVPNAKEVKARLQLNRTKLGKSYTQVIVYADDKKEKSKSKSKGTEPKTPVKKGNAAAVKKAAPVSEAMVLSDDDIEDPDEGREGEGHGRRDDDDPEVLREQGLEDDPVGHDQDEADQEPEEEGQNDGDDDDEIMGD